METTLSGGAGTIVMKFGGSSVATPEKLAHVADLVVATRETGHDVVVVVSAMGGTTDQLLELAKQVTDNPPRRELDMLLSTGERITMALLSMAIQKRGHDAISFTGSQSGIITNDRHFDAKIIHVRPHRIEDELARGRIVIVAGYQGMSYKREVTTLGRGGSDTTALALAAALGASRAEIYSDVDGVYSADPRSVPDATQLPELTYEQMQTMSDAGAKVLHAEAVAFAADAGIEIHARSTFKPGRQTVVGPKAGGNAVAVVGHGPVALVRGPTVTVEQAGQSFRAAGFEPRYTRSHGEQSQFLVYLASAPDWDAALERIRHATDASAEIRDDLALVTVAARFEHPFAVQGAAMRELQKVGISPLDVSATPTSIMCIVPQHAADQAAQALHRHFVE